jgi:hypothetical protein
VLVLLVLHAAAAAAAASSCVVPTAAAHVVGADKDLPELHHVRVAQRAVVENLTLHVSL